MEYKGCAGEVEAFERHLHEASVRQIIIYNKAANKADHQIFKRGSAYFLQCGDFQQIV